jgi:hypothetical protein
MGEVGRRRFLIGTGALIVTEFALAVESRANTPRVGFLISETLSGQASRIEALRAGLRDLGYVESKNIGSSFGLPMATTIGCPSWPRSWFASRST